MSGRNSHAGADEDAGGDDGADAHTEANCCTDTERDVGCAHRIAITDGTADTVADGNTVACIAEPRTCNTRLVRLGCDDRGVGVDLAPIPELIANDVR